MCVQTVAFALACLACVGHGVQSQNPITHVARKTEANTKQQKNKLENNLGAKRPLEPSKPDPLHTATSKIFIAKLLLAFTPAVSRQLGSHLVHSIAHPTTRRSSKTLNDAHWMDDALKYDVTPQFDVVKCTKEFSAAVFDGKFSKLDEDVVFRGSIMGPISKGGLAGAAEIFTNLEKNKFPDFEAHTFGYAIDPENPFRCMYYTRLRGTNTLDSTFGPFVFKATKKRVETPLQVISVHWTPDEKVKYVNFSPPLDRFEGNTKGIGFVWGMLVGTGIVKPGPFSSTYPGNPVIIFATRAMQMLGLQLVWSDDKVLPDWWKSKARGADPNDM